MDEVLGRMIARLNISAFIPPDEPTANEAVRKPRTKMAQKVKLAKGKEFDFGKAAQATKYPWDEWLNGDLLLLERSSGNEDDKGTIVEISEKRDFEVARDAMPAKLKTAARRRYKVVQISKRDADGKPLDNEGLIIRARDMTAEERQEEDLLRAEEKEKAKERRENKKDEDGDDGEQGDTAASE